MPNPPVIDLHEDLMLHIHERNFFHGAWQTSFEHIERNNFKIIVSTAFPIPPDKNWHDPVSNELIERDFNRYRQAVADRPNWRLVTSAKDIGDIMSDPHSRGLVLHIEGLNVITNHDWDRLEHWFELGWRSLGPVWNVTNPLGGGTKDPTQGLTALGRKMINWLQDRHMVIDFAHMNEPTFWDVAKDYRQPILISHGACRALCPGPRNYSDEQLKCVANSGGIVGIFFAKTYLTGGKPATASNAADHVDHLRDVMGIDHVALGTDLGGVTTGLVTGLESLDAMPAFWDELRRRGYSEDHLEQIASRNAQRVLASLMQH